GLSGMVRAEEMRQALLANPEPMDVCKVLTEKANEAGGHDNITVIVAKFDGPRPPDPEEATVKYTKYVFQTEDTTNYPPVDAHAAVPPPVAPGGDSAPRASSPSGAPV